MLSASKWSRTENDARYAELPSEIRDQSMKHALTLTGDFSLDYPKACNILNIEIHPLIHALIADYQPVPRPVEPVPELEPIAVSEPLPVPPPNVSGGKSQRGAKPDAKAAKGKKAEPAIPLSPVKPPEPVILYDRKTDERDLFVLSRCEIDAGTMAAISVCLPMNRFLTSIRLHQCTLPVSSFQSFFQLVSKSSIQMLSITAVKLNGEQDQFVASISSLLSSPSSIQYLNVGQNDFTDQHCSVIAQAIKSNNTVIGLDIAGNTVGPLTCQAFATSLASNVTLQYLNLAHTYVTASDIALLFACMSSKPVDKSAKKEPRVQTSKKGVLYREANTTLRHLDLRYTSVLESDEAVQSVINNRESTIANNPEADSGVGMYNRLDRIRCGRT